MMNKEIKTEWYLETNQTEWIFAKIKEFTDKYMALYPLNDEQWIEMVTEVKEIHKASGCNDLCKELLLASVHFFDMKNSEEISKLKANIA